MLVFVVALRHANPSLGRGLTRAQSVIVCSVETACANTAVFVHEDDDSCTSDESVMSFGKGMTSTARNTAFWGVATVVRERSLLHHDFAGHVLMNTADVVVGAGLGGCLE